MFCRVLHILASFSIIFLLPSPQAAAQSPDWETVFSEWSKNHPEQAQLWEKAKQDAEKNEKQIKDLSDKAFQQSFDTVFGKDAFKPSEALSMMKALEAASAGDFHAATETANAVLISRYMPVLGQYITAMKTLASGIRSAEQVWIKGLEQTPAYERFIAIYAERETGRNPYIPSYMITYLRNNKLLGGEITKIYNDMRAREDRMFERWQSDTFEIERLRLAPWASQWRSARGKVPDPRQMFNYFLYNLVKDAKHVYLERFTDEYMRPLIRREAYNQEQKIAHTMATALQNISAQAGASDNPAAQCAAHARSYQENIAAMSGKKREILSFYSRVKTAYTRKFDSYLRSDNAIQAERRRPLEEEKERLEADHKKALALKEEADRLDERLRSMGSEISSMRAALPPTSDTSAHNAAISSLNAKISSYNSFRSSEYLPAKRAADAAGEAYNEAADAHDAQQEAFYGDKVIDSQNQRLVRQFTRIRKSMEYFNAPQRTCLYFAKVAMEDNMQQLIGMDPAPGIAMCNVWETHRQAALKSGKASQADNCGK